jgi:hypothetical protein
MSYSGTIPMDVNPSVREALGELATLLRDYHYSEHAVGRILAHTAAHGTPTGAPELDREDEADAEMVFVAELEPVPFDHESWDREDVFLDVRLLADGTHPFPMPDADEGAGPLPEPPDVRDPHDWPDDDDDAIGVEELVPSSPAKADPDAEPPADWEGSAAAGWALALPPISGGSPDDGPGFVPSDEDWADYRQHFDHAEVIYGYE